jgi:sodium-independent sulfate anion transporter 11
VNNIDVTSMQQLIDARNQLDRHAYPNKVDWHFAHINNRWTKRALASVGFGHQTLGSRLAEQWKSIYSVADIVVSNSAVATTGKSELPITSIYNSSQFKKEFAKSQAKKSRASASDQEFYTPFIYLDRVTV